MQDATISFVCDSIWFPNLILISDFILGKTWGWLKKGNQKEYYFHFSNHHNENLDKILFFILFRIQSHISIWAPIHLLYLYGAWKTIYQSCNISVLFDILLYSILKETCTYLEKCNNFWWTWILIPYFSVGVNFTHKQKCIHSSWTLQEFIPTVKKDQNLSPSKVVTFL